MNNCIIGALNTLQIKRLLKIYRLTFVWNRSNSRYIVAPFCRRRRQEKNLARNDHAQYGKRKTLEVKTHNSACYYYKIMIRGSFSNIVKFSTLYAQCTITCIVDITNISSPAIWSYILFCFMIVYN